MDPVSKKTLWPGRVISTFAVLFLIVDAVSHLMKPTHVVAAFGQLGYPVNRAVGIGMLELVCIVIYVLPRTPILGAILLTGYLGGAVASNFACRSLAFRDRFPDHSRRVGLGRTILRG